jgi:undecaprenyl-diphosphatase
MIFVTTLGQPLFTVGSSMLVIGIGIGKNQDELIIAGSIAIITLNIATLLKLALRRKRPVTDYSEQMFFDTFSFPSGHASGSLVSYGLLCHLLFLPGSVLLSFTGVILALLIVLIGVSRVYLGAHYASDIVGGWIIGAIGLATILGVAY